MIIKTKEIMRTVKITVYKFSELTKDAKEVAINQLRDSNTHGIWWDSIYQDALMVNLRIDEFSIDTHEIDIIFTESAKDTVIAILENHGESTKTYQLAKDYKNDYENEWDQIDDDENLSKLLGQEYLLMLEEEYNYLTSDKGIIDTIESNGYEFTETGKLYSDKN